MHESSATACDFRETEAWITVPFSMRPGLKRDALVQRLREMLCPPPARM